MNTMFLLADTGSQTPSGFAGFFAQYGMIIMLVLMFVAMYFLMIRPQKKRQKEEQQMRENVRVGDKITTIGGIVGTVCAVKEKTIVVETGADRVRIEFVKWAVSSVGAELTEKQ